MSNTKVGHFGVLLLLLMVLFFPIRLVLAADLLSINKLIKEKNYIQAYQQATQLLDENAGEANFDFLYALSAIESGHPHHAIFALERLIDRFPDNDRIKVELARAYFMIGDFRSAEDLFKDVLKNSPPKNVELKITAFLLLIGERRLQLQSKWFRSVKLTAGWDSNYNSAPDLSIVKIGGIDFTLNENSRQQDTYYSGLDATINYLHFINKKLAYNYGIYYQQRDNISNELDTQILGANFSTIIDSNHGDFRIPVQFQQLNLDSDDYRQYASLGFEWTPTKQQQSRWTHFSQYGIIRYTDQSIRDMNLLTIGTSLQRISKTGTLYQTALYYSDETSVLDKGKYNEVDSLGLRGYIRWPVSTTSSLYTRITLQTQEYGANHPVFSNLRQDHNATFSLGWELKLNAVTYLKAEAEYLKNSSNIEIYDYDRTSAFISLRYDF